MKKHLPFVLRRARVGLRCKQDMYREDMETNADPQYPGITPLWPFERHVPMTDPKSQDSSEQLYSIEDDTRSKESIPRATADASDGDGISPAGKRPRWNAEVVHLAKATVRPAREASRVDLSRCRRCRGRPGVDDHAGAAAGKRKRGADAKR